MKARKSKKKWKMYGEEGREREWSLVEALHLALLIHFSLSITVMYANDRMGCLFSSLVISICQK